jgi:hypothetical protein
MVFAAARRPDDRSDDIGGRRHALQRDLARKWGWPITIFKTTAIDPRHPLRHAHVNQM